MAKQMATALDNKCHLGPHWQKCIATTSHLELSLHDQCSSLLNRIFRVADYSFQCNVIALNYIERMGGDTPPHEDWRAIVLTSLLLAQKMLDDCALWNVDFAHIGKMIGVQLSRRDINKTEKNILHLLDYKVDMSRSLFVQSYFNSRADSSAVSPVSPNHTEREELSMLKALDAQLSSHQPLHELRAKLNESLQSSSATSSSLSTSGSSVSSDASRDNDMDEFEKQLDFPLIESPEHSPAMKNGGAACTAFGSRASTGWSMGSSVMSRVMSAFSGNPEDDACPYLGSEQFPGSLISSSGGSPFQSEIKAKDSVKLARKARVLSSSGKSKTCSLQ
jgi:hypothetical protein